MTEYVKRINDYLSPETVSELVKDDMKWHYTQLLKDIRNIEKKMQDDETVFPSEKEDYYNNVSFSKSFEHLLRNYYAVDTDFIRYKVENE